MSQSIHIVCLDAPSPANYGGAIEMHYKIPALHQLGLKINLHYFDYKKGRSAEGLEKYCDAIYSYKRSSFTTSVISNQPYIVHSRINNELIERLNKDNHPVIIEGIHCSGIIPHINKNRKIVLRLHNDEAAYYKHLARWEKHPFKKIYFQRESKLLAQYQKQLSKNITIACLSDVDRANFETKYGILDAHFIPCFIPWQKIKTLEGEGDYCLYHGNLEISENIEAVKWLIENVFSELKTSLVVAGKGASALSIQYESSYVRFVDSPNDTTLNDLIANAHIHVLPSFNSTGVKLKLLHALFLGRFCMTNNDGVMGSGMENFVFPAQHANSWKTTIRQTMETPFDYEAIRLRQQILSLYNNQLNAKKLSELL